MGFQPGHKLATGRPLGSKNKSTLFKSFTQEMERLGFDLHKEWMSALQDGKFDLANAISKAFPHVSQRPVEEIFNRNEDLNAEENLFNKLPLEERLLLKAKLSALKEDCK